MRILFLLASLGLLALASEQASHVKPFDCGTDTSHASDDFLKTIEALHSGNPNSGSPATHAARAAAATGPITVDAVFHIVAKASSKSSVTNSMPSTQLKAFKRRPRPLQHPVQPHKRDVDDKRRLGRGREGR
jgi:hypothetical protein